MDLSIRSWMLITIFSIIIIAHSYGLAVMSVDIGSEWMKVAIVSPGVPMEIALNKESQRKTPVTVAFRDGDRIFGDPALTIGVRFPDKAYSYLLDVLGKTADNPIVSLYQKRFPYYSIIPDPKRNTIIYKHPEGMTFTPEELLAMILKRAQDTAERAAGQPIKDAVITVPPFFNQAERQSVLVGARMSGINVLQLINSNTAVALNYGVFRRKDFNETPSNIMFYDMGAGNTVATIVSYQLVKSKETGEVSPQLTVKGIGFDRTLGGLEMQLRLRDHFAKAFNSEKKTKMDILQNPRAMAKLLKEAGRVKKVLSANTDHVAQVESLLDDKDFRCPVSRSEFEKMCSDLFDRVIHPVEVALKSANMDMDSIDQVILAGSGARVPKVQQILLDYVKKVELGKSINTDESAALGAAYQAAHLSKGFKVKTFLVKDVNVYPIQIEFQRDYELEDGSPAIKTVKRLVFARNNHMPQKKAMTFNRLVKDFDFYVNYADLNFLNEFEIESLGSLNLSKVHVSSVSNAFSKHFAENVEYKGVKAHFRIDDNGLFQCHSAESVFEKPDDEEIAVSDIESTLTKLGNTIGRLFSSSDTPEDKAKEPIVVESNSTNDTVKQEDTLSSSIKPTNTSEKEKTSIDTKKNDSVKEANVTKESKIKTVKEPLAIETVFSGLQSMSDSETEESIQKLKILDDLDLSKLAKEKTKNSLEAFIIDAKDKLSREEYEAASTESELSSLRTALDTTRDWLEYESDDSTKLEDYKSRLTELRKSTKDLYERVKEHHDRPDAIRAINDMLNLSSVFLGGARNMSEDEQIFTEVELKTLEKLITETKKWLKENKDAQAALSLNVQPKLTAKLIAEKIANLDREVKYLLNKARFAAPLKKKKEADKNETKVKQDNSTDPGKQSTPNETEKVVPVVDIPETTTEVEEPEMETSSPNAETPSPDSVEEKSHSEL